MSFRLLVKILMECLVMTKKNDFMSGTLIAPTSSEALAVFGSIYFCCFVNSGLMEKSALLASMLPASTLT